MTFTDQQQQIIERALASGDIPGLSVAIVENGQLGASAGFGLRDRDANLPMTADTLSSIASLTKSFTGVAIMILAEQGLLSLDEPVQSYLPWFRVADERASRTITPRMLLSHKSGMGRTGHQTRVFNEPVSPYADRADLVRRLKDVQLQTPPNEAWSYCNEGYVTLGLLIVTLSGIPLETFYAEQIFKPLGMEHTHAGFSAWKNAEDGTTGYRWTPDGLVTAWLPDEYSVYLSTGGIVSNAPDLARYQIACMDYEHNPLLSAGSLEQMHTISMPFGDTGWGYGLGWWVRWHAGVKMVAHSGGQAGVATYSLMLPLQQAGVVVVANRSGAKVADLAEELAGTLLGHPLFRPSVTDPLPVSTRAEQPTAQERARYSGTYAFESATMIVSESNDRLSARSYAPDEPEAEASDLLAIDTDLFMSLRDGALVKFLIEHDGSVQYLLAGGNLFRRNI